MSSPTTGYTSVNKTIIILACSFSVAIIGVAVVKSPLFSFKLPSSVPCQAPISARQVVEWNPREDPQPSIVFGPPGGGRLSVRALGPLLGPGDTAKQDIQVICTATSTILIGTIIHHDMSTTIGVLSRPIIDARMIAVPQSQNIRAIWVLRSFWGTEMNQNPTGQTYPVSVDAASTP